MAKKPTINDVGLEFKYALSPINKTRITKLVMHHMAHRSWDIHDVHDYHKDSNGWNGIGYNYWIGFDGTIYEGRGMHLGAHASGYNSTSIGVGYQGDFTKQTMPDAQLEAGKILNAWLMDEFNLSKSDIIGHGDLPNASTACPGKNFRMTELRGDKTETTFKGASKPKWTKVTGNWTGQTLGSGEYGVPVKQLQTKLAESLPPFYPNKGAKDNGVDSYFGDDTEDAVRRFQTYYGLDVDGLAGAQVYDKLTSRKSTKAKTSAPKLPNATFYVKSPMFHGSRVRAVQEVLASIYFYPDKGAKDNGVDGYYGGKTADAVRRFQSVHMRNRDVDGVYGPKTKAAIERLIK